MKLHGRNGQIEIGTGSPLSIIGSLNAWNISGTRDKVDVTSFGDVNKTSLAGLKDGSGGFEGFFDTSYIGQLLEAADSATGAEFKITPSTTQPLFYISGPCWLDISMTGAVNDAVKITGSLAANGEWVYTIDGSPVA